MDADSPAFALYLDRLQEVIDDDAFWQEAGVDVKRRARPKFATMFQAGVDASGVAAKARRAEIRLSDFIDLGAEVMDSYLDDWWAELSETSRRRLREALAEARRDALSPQALAARIEDVFGPQRAALIAVTEGTRLMGLGAQASYADVGYTRWEWQTTNDNDVDEICESLQGEEFPMSRPFEPAHPNCRCWPVPVGESVQIAPDGSEE